MSKKVLIQHIYNPGGGKPGLDEFEVPANFVPDLEGNIPDCYIVAFATADNASRIADAWKECQGTPGPSYRFMVAAPGLFRDELYGTPSKAPEIMRKLLFDGLSPHKGGLRMVRAKDYVHFRLMSEYRLGIQRAVELVKKLKGGIPTLEQQQEACEGMIPLSQMAAYCASHLLWPRLRWIYGVTFGWFATLVTLLEDPYWYSDPEKPKSSLRFKRAMMDEAVGEYSFLAQVLQNLPFLVIGTMDLKDPKNLSEWPEMFFQRYYLRHLTRLRAEGVSPEEGHVHAARAAAEKLINWIWLNWTEVLLPDHAPQEVFASRFFGQDKAAAGLAEFHRIW